MNTLIKSNQGTNFQNQRSTSFVGRRDGVPGRLANRRTSYSDGHTTPCRKRNLVALAERRRCGVT